MEYTKRDIRSMIAAGNLESATQAALSYAEYCQEAEVLNGLTVMAGNLEAHKKKWDTGQIAYEEYSRAHAQVTHGLAGWLDRLPDIPTRATKKRRLVDEGKFKSQVFYFLCLAKVLAIVYVVFHWSGGGFNKEQFFSTIGILGPTFGAYISVMLADYLRAQKEGPKPERRLVLVPVLKLSYWLFPAYVLCIVYVINLKIVGNLTIGEMNTALAMVETLLGGYIGQIVFAFFSKE
jgi:hypothetical protein